jgi:hypothetical protein
MQTHASLYPLHAKTSQLDTTDSGLESYLYYCTLCDETLVCSRRLINPQKIQLAFDNSCPGCSFDLDRVLGCQPSVLPPGRRLLTNLRCENAQVLAEPEDSQDKRAPRDLGLSTRIGGDLTTGIDSIDKILVLKKGQMVALHGEPSHALSLLLCVRAILPAPRGLGSSVVFIDAGNVYDSYSISQHAINLGLELANVRENIHLSRAFTHHQVHNLITEKLAPTLNEYNASVAVVSDITALFCDPDVRDKREALDAFRKSILFLAKTASNKNRIVIVTDLKTRDKKMKDALDQTAHISCSLEDMEAYTQLTVTRHPFILEKSEAIDLDLGTLTAYLQ